MKKTKIIVAGIGPGSPEDITPATIEALKQCKVIVGYKYYFQFVEDILSEDTICIDSGMKKEKQRAEEAFNYALQGNDVCVISSGDAGIYGMAPLIYEMKKEKGLDNIEIEVLPGISAFQKAASIFGCPIGHDLCIISLSDLMTPWNIIEKRIEAAAMGDFVTCIYNPKSRGRYWQIYRLIEIFKKYRDHNNILGYVRQAGREEEKHNITTINDFDPEDVDMFTVIIIGNSQSYNWNNHFITPRGYYREDSMESDTKIGQSIMIESFRTIHSELSNTDVPLDHKWALIHSIHTTADFDMEGILYTDENAVRNLHNDVVAGKIKTVVTDVTMVASGIRKGALERLGVEVKCYLNDPRASEMATKYGITRSQAGIRLAVEECDNAIYAFGNAPTALIELCELIRKGKANVAGIIASPVGFVNVKESKYMAKTFKNIPKIIVEGRKGGSNLAATLVNSILTFDDAEQLRPGRDV